MKPDQNVAAGDPTAVCLISFWMCPDERHCGGRRLAACDACTETVVVFAGDHVGSTFYNCASITPNLSQMTFRLFYIIVMKQSLINLSVNRQKIKLI